MTPPPQWPGAAPQGPDSTITAARDAAPRLPYGRRHVDDAGGAHIYHDVVGVHAPPGRSSAAHLQGLVDEFRTIKRARADGWRRMAEILLEIRRADLWVDQAGQGGDFDAWCWRTLHVNRRQVSALLGVATAPVGGTGRRRGPKPGHQAAADTAVDAAAGGAPRAGAPMRAQAQIGEVEGIPETAITSTSAAGLSSGIATGPELVQWAAHHLETLAQRSAAVRVAGLTEAERPAAVRTFMDLSAYFADCARAADAPPFDLDASPF